MYERLIKFYKASIEGEDYQAGGIWSHIMQHYQKPMRDALESGDAKALEIVLGKMAESGGLHGLEDNCGILVGSDRYINMMEKIANRIGVLPIFNPEQPYFTEHPKITGLDKVQTEVESVLGFKIGVPECFGYSLQQPAQVIPHRFFFYCAAAFTIRSWFKGGYPKNILEIGAGLGNLGWISRQCGCSFYTVIDLPSVAVLSAFFLSKCHGENSVWLYGEGEKRHQFCEFYPASKYDDVEQSNYDLIFNSDSLPEMPEAIRDGYIDMISRCLSRDGIFLSINHESGKDGQGRVFDSVKRNGKLKLVSRSPFMMRDGYVEEIYCLV